MVEQYYSHMYKLDENLIGKWISADEMITLGETGTNGYSAGPHLHIRSTWSHGWNTLTYQETIDNTPEPRPVYPQKEKDRVWTQISPMLLFPLVDD